MLKQTFKWVSYAEQAALTAALLTRLSFYARYQHYSTTFTPHSSERQRERQRGLAKQTFELDVAATEPQDDQVAHGHQSPVTWALFTSLYQYILIAGWCKK